MKKYTAITLACLSFVFFLNRVVSAADDSLDETQNQAVEFYQAGRYDAAIPLYRKIVNAHPENKGALKDLLTALWLGNHYEEAADIGARLTPLSKNDVDAEFIYARALLAIGQKEEALAALQRCRELDPDEQHIQLAAARVETMLRDYDSALSHMQDLKEKYPDFKELYPELARVQQITGNYAAAAVNWDKAADAYPDNRAYRFHEAESLYYAGQRDEAMKALRALTADKTYWPAIDFMTDINLATGHEAAARALLEDHLKTLRPDDEGRLLKLIHLDQQEGRWNNVIVNSDRWLALDPRNGTALMFKADALQNQGHYKRAISLYQEIFSLNPSSLAALRSMAKAQNADGRPRDAVQTIKKARALDPTDPYLLIFESYYLYEAGDVKNPKAILEQWISSHPDPAVPALLYHGVTFDPQDPILAYAIHRTTATLEDHFKALHDAHYTPVTAEQVNAWMTGQGSLPKHPILITFDDARLDSFKDADPLLKTYGLKATMFAPLVEVEGYIPKFASWKDLAAYQGTGRWEIESHGDRAHELIPTDIEEGHHGLFLLNKQWLPDDRRLETDGEWTTRVVADYEKSEHKIENHLGQAPHAYAFPEGNYGQEGISNSTDAATNNLVWVAKTYGTAYHEDDYGFNDRSRDPLLLTRYEPTAGQTGKALLRHFTDQSPAVLMIRRLLRQAAWEQRIHEADHWLQELQSRGASPSCLWAEEARIRYAQGNWDAARVLADKALRDDDSPENRDLLQEINGATRSEWKGNFAYAEDNKNRISRTFRQDLGFWHAAGLDWSLHQLFGTYSEAGAPTVTDSGGGVGVARNLGDFHRLSIEATGHALNATARDTYSILGDLHSGWTENFSTTLGGGRDIYNTARAIDANITNRFATLLAQWQPQNDWRASAKTQLEDLSDDNKFAIGILEGTHQLWLPHFWLVARATLETTKFVSPDYYSPQVLQEYQLGFNYTYFFTKESNLNVAYMPGYGKEKVSDGEFVNDIDATLNLAITHSLMFIPAVYLIRQPTYHRNTYSASLAYRF